MNRRIFGCMVGAFACWAGPIMSPAHADMFGLAIGIDDYAQIGKLQGAVNDALDIADALKTAGAKKVVTLLDRTADRDSIMKAWRDLIAGSGPDDILVFSYAGHGGQEPEKTPGDEEDGLDETFLLAGFSPNGAGTYQRIVDNEVAAMLKAAEPRRVIFIADSCHSGTMTRSVDKRVQGLPTRNAKYGKIENDVLPPPTREIAEAEKTGLSNVVFFGAVSEHELAPEVRIDGKPRGALSWSFARALRGGADGDGDGIVTKDELEKYIRESVRMKMDGRQRPQVQPQGQSRAALLPGQKTAAVAAFAGLAPAETIKLASLGGDAWKSVLDELEMTAPTADANQARLVFDGRTGEIVTALGDVAGAVDLKADRQVVKSNLQSFIDKWILFQRLEKASNPGSLSLSLVPSEKKYLYKDKVRLEIKGSKYNYLTLINISANGTLNFIYPLRDGGFNDPLSIPIDRPYVLDLEIDQPFGADHFIGLFTREPLEDLHRTLKDLDGKPAARSLADALDRALAGKAAEVGWHQIFSADRPAVGAAPQ